MDVGAASIMDLLKRKRAARRARLMKTVNEARSLLDAANVDIVKLTGAHDCLLDSNDQLVKVNDELEDHILAEDYEAEFATVMEYSDLALNMLAELRYQITALGRAQNVGIPVLQAPAQLTINQMPVKLNPFGLDKVGNSRRDTALTVNHGVQAMRQEEFTVETELDQKSMGLFLVPSELCCVGTSQRHASCQDNLDLKDVNSAQPHGQNLLYSTQVPQVIHEGAADFGSHHPETSDGPVSQDAACRASGRTLILPSTNVCATEPVTPGLPQHHSTDAQQLCAQATLLHATVSASAAAPTRFTISAQAEVTHTHPFLASAHSTCSCPASLCSAHVGALKNSLVPSVLSARRLPLLSLRLQSLRIKRHHRAATRNMVMHYRTSWAPPRLYKASSYRAQLVRRPAPYAFIYRCRPPLGSLVRPPEPLSRRR